MLNELFVIRIGEHEYQVLDITQSRVLLSVARDRELSDEAARDMLILFVKEQIDSILREADK